ncbi:alpha/beta hydrolase [Chryseobacterium sp. LC2016-27]|uniref:alpha/beta hydrolase family protein n=1 Tax=Chryseobacterium sp. LC2016-27 TaxID=2897326 RepID=UPI001E473BA1|nr:alpha/beta hydrolase [Chryseobacterium sp. LC2016-27]MCD0453958.1 alpha/beta hydrolase [Chryseobacterium sp. LC2016-27]
MKKNLKLLFLALIIFSCKEKTIRLNNNISFDVQKNISYGKNSAQQLDLYFPKNKNSIKGIVVIVHGGGWKAGDKSDLTRFALSMMEKFPDHAFANINYRLANNSSFIVPNQTDDIDNALDFLVKKSKEMKFSPQFILIGNSAGAHLSMLYGYNTLFDDTHRTKVKTIVNIVGPADLSDPNFKNYSDYAFVEKHMIDLSKSTPTDITNQDIPNPVYWINKNSPPTISFYGINDNVIPLSQKKILDSVLNKNQVFSRSYEFSGGHLDWNNEKNAPFVINSISEFLKQIDNNKTP